MQQPKVRLGEILVKLGFITEEHIEVALKIQKIHKKKLGEILKELGFVSPRELALALAYQANLPYINLEEYYPKKEALFLLTKRISSLYNALCVDIDPKENSVLVVIDDPYDIRKQATIRSLLKNYKVKFAISEPEAIIRAIEIYYTYYTNPLDKQFTEEVLKPDPDIEKVVDLILNMAIYYNASDIHINPLSNVSFLFLRIDGILQPMTVIPYSLHGPIVSKIKLMANMNVAERRIPQDGSFSYSSLGQKVDVRVSTLPTAFGEKVVMRVLKKDISKLNLDFLGFLEPQKQLLRKAINLSFGMVIVSGPTGSGKSTTLYSLLRSINYLKRNVVTVEDPIEYRFNFIYQTEINTAIGYKFSTALKYFMRQDPDVILLGEIRDDETANTAIEAANTGHLLLSTIHANCSVTTVQRLLNLVRDKDMALSVLKVISAQRLLRKLCPFCKEEAKEDIEILKSKYPTVFELLKEEPKVYRAKGCERCGGRGYIGRTVLAEVLELDDNLINMFYQNASLVDIKKKLEEQNFLDMSKVAAYKILTGETDINEAKRVLGANFV